MVMSGEEIIQTTGLASLSKKQNTKEIKLSEYPQHVKEEEILLINLKRYRTVERVGTLVFL